MFSLVLATLLCLQAPQGKPADPAPNAEVARLLSQGKATQGNDPQAALKLYAQAEKLAHTQSDVRGESQALFRQGLVYDEARQYEQALQKLTAALALQKAAKLAGVPQILNNMGIVYDEQGDYQKALAAYEEGITYCEKVSNIEDKAYLLLSLADTRKNLGDKTVTKLSYRKALEAARTAKLTELEGKALNNLGNFLGDIGEPFEAMSALDKAVPLLRKAQNQEGESGALLNQGVLLDQMGMSDEAMERYQQAAKLMPPESLQRQLLQNNIAILYLNRHDTKGAERVLRHLLARAKQGDPTTIPWKDNLGLALQDQGKWEEAATLHRQALLQARQAKDHAIELMILDNLGRAELGQNHRDKAAQAFSQALALSRRQGRRLEAAIAEFNLGMVQEAWGQNAAAESAYLNAVREIERIHGLSGGSVRFGQSLLQKRLALYHRAVWRLIQNGKTAEAFALAQKTKARALLDIMEASGDPDEAFLTQDEQTQQAALQQKIAALQTQLDAASMDETPDNTAKHTQLERQLTAAETEFAVLQQRLYERHPELARRNAAQTLTLDDLPRVLDTQTALIEFVALSDTGDPVKSRTQTVAFVVTVSAGKPKISVVMLPGASALDQRIAQFRAACSRPGGDYKQAAQSLYKTLVAPLASAVVGKSHLVFCPDGGLWDVPFHALHDGKRFLLERFAVTSAYSASALQAAQSLAPTKTGTLLACANPTFDGSRGGGDMKFLPGSRPLSEPTRPKVDSASAKHSEMLLGPRRDFASAPEQAKNHHPSDLPGAQREADFLAKTEPNAQVFSRAKAQETTVKALLERAQIIHFATHGLINDSAPMLSCLLLADPDKDSPDDGFLTARELSRMHLKAELAVLSACNTARGKIRRGEGIVGLTWAIFAAGVPTEILSEWSVDDAATAELMTRFYKAWHQKKSKSEALRTAELSLLRDTNPKWHHPYYWSPFILMGKP